jgi:methionyl-tRNA synthetase
VDQARFAKFWPADMHLIGKEISRFHCVYWPAFLMAAGIPTPRSVKANGWLLFDQGKMSKSRGNIIRAETVQEILGADALRYFLLREIPFGQDGSFSFDALVQRYNGDLANGYGNLVSRVVNMMHKYFDGVVPFTLEQCSMEAQLQGSASRAIAAFGSTFDELKFSEALTSLWLLIAEADGYLTTNAPWKKPADCLDADHAALQARVLATAAEAIRIITALVYPILPDAAAKVWRQLGQGEIADAAKKSFLTELAWGGLKAGTKFGEPAPLFPRAEKDAAERMQMIEEQNNLSVVQAASVGGAGIVLSATTDAQSSVPEKTPPSTAPNISQVSASRQGTTSVVPQKQQNKTGALAPEELVLENPSSIPTSPAPAALPNATAPAVSVPNANPAAEPSAAQHITIDDVLKVDLRVAQILVAERVPKADKLLRLEVDLGYEKRQILAGIAQYYEPEKLIGRKIVIVANLAPRKMRGLESNGMLLAASLEGGSPVLAGFLEEVPLGARLK